MPFTDKDRHLTKAFQKEKHDTASQLLKEYKLESSLMKSLSEKLIISLLFGSGRGHIAQLGHAVIIQFSGITWSWYLNMR